MPHRSSSVVERQPIHQKVSRLIPGQGTYPGGGLNPQQEAAIDVDALMFLSLSKKSI